ncbi:radical SAM/SPASM domain-containing protein, partial [Omnitrophica bacterium]|nr:radical SAM/SPASM domain-containing protein [Candidatus Omnitrophota bacterium]
NSLINLHNANQLDDLIDLITSFEIVFWEVFFLVPVGRGQEIPLITADQFEKAFEKIYRLSKDVPFLIKITEAPHYRRYYFDQEILRDGGDLASVRRSGIDLPAYMRKLQGPGGSIGRAPSGVNSGKGFIFISHRGEVFPSGFLPLCAGDFRKQPLKTIYQDSALLRELRDPSLLKGRCGLCPYNEICGGSRSRAYAMTGDYLAEDPCCNFQPD